MDDGKKVSVSPMNYQLPRYALFDMEENKIICASAEIDVMGRYFESLKVSGLSNGLLESLKTTNAQNEVLDEASQLAMDNFKNDLAVKLKEIIEYRRPK